MSHIGVGINENVLIAKAFMNDKKRLVIELVRASAEATKKTSVFDKLLTAGVQNESNNNMELQFLGPLLPKKEDMTREKKIDLLSSDLQRLRNQFTQILEQYMLSEKIDMHSMDVMFANTGIVDGDTYEARLLDQDVLNKIYENLANRFIDLIKPFLGNSDYKLRFKLIRQSKEKHFATIPSRFISDQPFVELMDVPAEQSRVKFSAYEIKEGLNDGTPIRNGEGAEKKGDDGQSQERTTALAETNPFAPQ